MADIAVNQNVPDPTLVVASAVADPDATMVISHGAQVPTQGEDQTRVEFHRKVQARAKAKAKKQDAIVLATATDKAPTLLSGDGKPKRAFFSPVITNLVARGLLSQRDAISASLRARDQGITFLSALAQTNAMANDEAFYRGVAEEAGLAFIATERELVQRLAEAEWLTFKEAEQRGCLLLQPGADGRQQYAAIDPFYVITHDWVFDRVHQ